MCPINQLYFMSKIFTDNSTKKPEKRELSTREPLATIILPEAPGVKGAKG